jgi:uncharacterized protein YciI
MPETLHVVFSEHGPGWAAGRPLEEQELWPEHAAFMDGLVDDGFIILGGPLGDGERVLLVVKADDENAIRSRLAPDPWIGKELLRIVAVEPWTIRLDGRS